MQCILINRKLFRNENDMMRRKKKNNYNDIASYISNRSANLLLSDKISTVNGKATYKLNFGENLWGRKFIKVTDPITGHAIGKIFYVTYSGWWNRSG